MQSWDFQQKCFEIHVWDEKLMLQDKDLTQKLEKRLLKSNVYKMSQIFFNIKFWT